MNLGFYTAGAGAVAQQNKMNVTANNMANINTTGYKSKNPTFSDLMYLNYTDAQGNHLQTGTGVKMDKTTSKFEPGGYNSTGADLDFAIVGDGFFAVQDLDGEDTLYTRDGRFAISILDDTMYLTNSSGQVVLNQDGDPIEMTDLNTDATMEEMNIGVFTVPIRDGMLSDGFNNFRLEDKNGEPELKEDAEVLRGYLETSNVDMAQEMSQVIEAQRAYSLSLKMLQTADEVEQEVNALRR